MLPQILDTGISIVYEPTRGLPVVDILFVHGLHGHPYKSWTSPRESQDSAVQVMSSSESPHNGKYKLKNIFHRAETQLPLNSSKRLSVSKLQEVPTDESGQDRDLFWPADLLPQEFPSARILMFGYDSKVTKYMSKATNKSSLLSHSKDLVFSLGRERPQDRPLIILAHSLGGILVKEVLSYSSMSTETELRNIVESTEAVIFLGTPHRGSPDFARFGQLARSIVSSLGMETTPLILDSLGMKTTDLQRAQESFSGLWHKYEFRVKTFQEGLGLTGVKLGGLGNKVVPDYSSSIGDPREHAETLQANHKEMCRFKGPNDPNYRKVVGEIRSIYCPILNKHTQIVHQQTNTQGRPELTVTAPSDAHPSDSHPVIEDSLSTTESNPIGPQMTESSPPRNHYSAFDQQRLPPILSGNLTMDSRLISYPGVQTELDPWIWLRDPTNPRTKFIQSLRFQNMFTRYHNIRKPAEGTAAWVQVHEHYHDWLHDQSLEARHGILWLKGKPGAGKSVLMKEMYEQAITDDEESEGCTAAFFFNAKGDELGNSPAGLLRSLLYQLLGKKKDLLQVLGKKWSRLLIDEDDSPLGLGEDCLKNIFLKLFTEEPLKKTLIFIDALDECNPRISRSLADFFHHLVEVSRMGGTSFSVCISSRHVPSITIGDCLEIVMEDHNNRDIVTYVVKRLTPKICDDRNPWGLLRDKIIERSAGVFLWVVLIMDEVLRKSDEGESWHYLLRQVDMLPNTLDILFSQILETLSSNDRDLALRIFQWAILATKPLRLYEWHHILAFVGTSPPKSLREWRQSNSFTETDCQLEKRIKHLSRGLLEVNKIRPVDAYDPNLETSSNLAGAGSLLIDYGETRVIQVIHESIREYFLRGTGFSVLKPIFLGDSPIGEGHLSIMRTCMKYLAIEELDALVDARQATYDSESEVSDDLSVLSKSSGEDSSISKRLTKGHIRASLRKDPATLPFTPSRINFEDLEEYPLYHPIFDGPLHSPTLGLSRYAPFQKELSVSTSSFNPTSEIDRWIRSVEAQQRDDEWDRPLSNCSASDSLSQKTRILEDHPALLSYSLFEFFTHAFEARESGISPNMIAEEIHAVFDRWAALREDIPWHIKTQVALHALKFEQALGDKRVALSSSPVDLESNQQTSQKKSRYRRKYRRNRSVASFSSASSHSESMG